MTDGTNPPSSPQPEPAPGSGYGFPPGPPAQNGYGYPVGGGGYGYGYPQSEQQPNPYQQEADGGQWPPATQAQPAQPGFTRLAGPDIPGASQQPDWEAMAERSDAERRKKKKLWMLGGTVTVLALLAGGGTFFLLGGEGGEDGANAQPSTSAAPEPEDSKSPSVYTATVAGDDTLLRDSYGSMGIRLGTDLKVGPLGKRFQVVGRGNGNSWGQSAEPVVDVTKSFTITARAYSSAAKGSRIVMSQGDGESFSFELGVNEVNGKQAWIFRVQTGDKGAAATTRTVAAEGLTILKTPTLLMATYDAEKKAIALYVDGKKAGETPVPPIWQAPGPLQLGRSKHHNIWTGPWQGALHNIKVYNSAFTQEQAAGYKEGKLSPAPKPTHAWLLT
ncbi:LamG-like jellyroll fold domain-containing protein [Streptomyces erythrochromogenes]|uniref:LamG-like jellyroll fold domain-containing protein n=1 Tax=Streptomyces erythrochromogenes TaxID=285574 RepID=UPI003643B1EB